MGAFYSSLAIPKIDKDKVRQNLIAWLESKGFIISNESVILEKQLDKLEDQPVEHIIPSHENIRGSQYYNKPMNN